MNKDLNIENITKNKLFKHLSTTENLVEKATNDIMLLLKDMEKHIDLLPKNNDSIQLKNIILSIYEICTFEDLVSQHLNKVKLILEDNNNDSLLSGPAVKGEQSLSQAVIDKMLKE